MKHTQNFAIAVKAFIVSDGKVLLLKRRPTDVHKPDEWDIPGGRLDHGENPMEGVRREALEETGLAVEPQIPIDIHHFTRDDGQSITMIIFLCTSKFHDIMLSQEHTEYAWTELMAEISEFPQWLHPVIEKVSEFRLVDHI